MRRREAVVLAVVFAAMVASLVLLGRAVEKAGVELRPRPIDETVVSTTGSTTAVREERPTTAAATSTTAPAPATSTTARVRAQAAGTPATAARRWPARSEVVERRAGAVRVSSTAYCLTGTMANGRRTHRGAVAGNRWPLGTRLRVSPSPVGEVVVVEDRIGHGSELDFALPGDCAAARAWGRRTVTVEVVR